MSNGVKWWYCNDFGVFGPHKSESDAVELGSKNETSADEIRETSFFIADAETVKDAKLQAAKYNPVLKKIYFPEAGVK